MERTRREQNAQKERMRGGVRHTEQLRKRAPAKDSVARADSVSAAMRYRFFVGAIANREWALASLLPQFAVCRFFNDADEAAAYRDSLQKIKVNDEGVTVPDGPIFTVLEVGKPFMLAYNPQRMFGSQHPNLIAKAKLLRDKHYLQRELERLDVLERSKAATSKNLEVLEAEESNKTAAATTAATAAATDAEERKVAPLPKISRRAKRVVGEKETRKNPYAIRDANNAIKRARIHAYETLRLLRQQLEYAKMRSEGKTALDEYLEDEDEDDFEALLEDLPEHMRAIARRKREARGSAADAADTSAPKDDEHEPSKRRTRMISLEEAIKYYEHKYAQDGIKPASEEEIAREELEVEERALQSMQKAKRLKGCPRVMPDKDRSLGEAARGQEWFIATVILDTLPKSLNKGTPEATGFEHMVRVMDCECTVDRAIERAETRLASIIEDEDMDIFRTATWICPDRNFESEDARIKYRSDIMDEFQTAQRSNANAEFIKYALAQCNDAIAKPVDFEAVVGGGSETPPTGKPKKMARRQRR